MRIFALETNVDKLIKKFLNEGEDVILVTPYHILSFFFASLREFILSIVLIAAGVFAWRMEWPMLPVLGILFAIWVIFVLFNLLKASVDWMYDCIVVTEDKVILIDQTSVFKQEVSPIYVDNIGAISTETQFWNIFPFGTVKIHLKEGVSGNTLTLRYVPRAQEVASVISSIVTKFQRNVGREDELDQSLSRAD